MRSGNTTVPRTTRSKSLIVACRVLLALHQAYRGRGGRHNDKICARCREKNDEWRVRWSCSRFAARMDRCRAGGGSLVIPSHGMLRPGMSTMLAPTMAARGGCAPPKNDVPCAAHALIARL